ncbi:MAG: hypothetical protein J6V82_05420, partial [Clostridia bacterium]|nr:hypothetical protein [Clostridia bacterium]
FAASSFAEGNIVCAKRKSARVILEHATPPRFFATLKNDCRRVGQRRISGGFALRANDVAFGK